MLTVLKYVHQPYWNAELHYVAKSYKISENYADFNHVEKVKEFVSFYERKTLLGKREMFSIYNPLHLKQAKSFFNVLYNAKDYAALTRVTIWARFNVNEKMFMYVVGLIQTHRSDVNTLVLPPPYEMCPFQFINGEVIKKAQQVAMQGFYNAKKVNGYREVVIPMNYTGWIVKLNEDQALTYLTEDPTWNAMYYNYNLNYPFWLGGEEYGLHGDRRGESFIGMHHFKVARYYLERLSNDLGEIEDFNWRKPIKSGYHPFLMLVNGQTIPGRDNFHSLYDDQTLEEIHRAEDHERRILDVIARGFYYYNGEKIELYKNELISEIGNFIQGNLDAKFNHNFINQLSVPRFLENPATAARDPLFYQYFNHILKIFWQYMSHIEPYKKEDVGFSGVEIKSVEFDTIETFFEDKEIDITNAVEVPPDARMDTDEVFTEENFKRDDIFVKTRYQRLNYKPFEMKFNVHSDKAQPAYLRMFIGPRDESLSNQECFENHRKYYYLIDVDIVELKAGDNLVVRRYPENKGMAYFDEQTSYFELYRMAMAAKSGKEQWPRGLHKGRCGIVDHLKFPRGKIGGMKYQILTLLTPIDASKSFDKFDPSISCGIGTGQMVWFGSKSLLFPMDRRVDPLEFYVPNLNLNEIEIEFKPAY